MTGARGKPWKCETLNREGLISARPSTTRRGESGDGRKLRSVRPSRTERALEVFRDRASYPRPRTATAGRAARLDGHAESRPRCLQS
jgi:hypothetical protein